MLVSRSLVSVLPSTQCESLLTGANAISRSEEGSGPGSVWLRRKRFELGPDGRVGSTDRTIEKGWMSSGMATRRGPVRRSKRGAIALRQFAAACARFAAL